MTKHISEDQIRRYENRLMAPAEFSAVSAHFARCENCYNRLNKTVELESAYSFLREELLAAESEQTEHPAFEEISAYVDDRMNWADKEMLESHTESCSECNMEVQDLRILRSAFDSRGPALERQPANTKRAFFARVFDHKLAAGIAGLAVMAVLVYWVVILPLEKEVQQLQRLNGELQNQASEVARLRQQIEELKRENEKNIQQQAELALANPDEPNSALPYKQPFESGGRVTLNQQGELVGVESLPPPYRRLLASAWATGELRTPPVLKALTSRAGTLMSTDRPATSFALSSPVGTVIEGDRPTFRWQALEGADSYTVIVRDSRSNNVAVSQPLQSAEWAMPFRLERGGLYTWQVRAVKGGAEILMPPPGTTDAKFKILERAKTIQLQRAKEIYKDSPLLLSVIYADAGLIDDAERELQTLLDSNPSSAILEKLLLKLKALKQR